VGFLCLLSAAVLEHKLSILSCLSCPPPPTQEPGRYRLILSGFRDSLSDVALIDVNVCGLWEVEFSGPGVGVVSDDFYFTIYVLLPLLSCLPVL